MGGAPLAWDVFVGEGLSEEWVRRKHKCEVSPFLVLVVGSACMPLEHMSFSTYARIFCGEGCGFLSLPVGRWLIV